MLPTRKPEEPQKTTVIRERKVLGEKNYSDEVFGENVSQFSIRRPFIFEKWRMLPVTMISLGLKAVEPIMASSMPSMSIPVFDDTVNNFKKRIVFLQPAFGFS